MDFRPILSEGNDARGGGNPTPPNAVPPNGIGPLTFAGRPAAGMGFGAVMGEGAGAAGATPTSVGEAGLAIGGRMGLGAGAATAGAAAGGAGKGAAAAVCGVAAH